MKLAVDDIQKLILVGRVLDKPTTELMSYFKLNENLNCQDRETWRKTVEDISDSDLILIFKGLVILESHLNWLGGSVAGAIWIYAIIQNRGLDKAYNLADFGLRNCENPWIPFGSSYYGKRTITDYFSYKSEKAFESSIKFNRYSKVLKRVEGRKKKRVDSIAELRKLNKEQRGDIRTELFAKYCNATINEKLEIIANDNIFPPEYYPVEWIKISDDEVQKLSLELIKKLYDKLSTKTKGEWKRFAQRLLKFDDGI